MSAQDDILKWYDAQEAESLDPETDIQSAQQKVADFSAMPFPSKTSFSTEKKSEGNTLAGLKVGYEKEQGLVSDFGDYLASEYPKVDDAARTAVANVLSTIPGVELTDFKSAGQEYGEDYYDLSPQERRERIIATRVDKAKAIADYYSYEMGASPVAEGFGSFGAEVADPTSLIPLGAGLKTAVTGGAVLGGLGGAAEGLAEKGEVSAEEVTVGAVIGAATGGLIEIGVIKPISRLVENARNQGRTLNADEVSEVLKNTGADSAVANASQLTSQLNSEFNLNLNSPKVEATIKREVGKENVTYTSFDTIQMEERMGEVPTETTYKLPSFDKDPGVGFASTKGSKAKNKIPHVARFDNELAGIVKAGDYYTWQRKNKSKITSEPIVSKPGAVTRKREAPPTSLTNKIFEEKFAQRQEVFQVLKDASLVDSPLSQIGELWRNNKYAMSGDGVPGEITAKAIADQQYTWNSNLANAVDPLIGTLDDIRNPKNALGKWVHGGLETVNRVISPAARLQQAPTAVGKHAEELLRRAHERRDARVGKTLTDYRKTRNKLGIKQASSEELLAIQYLRGTVKNVAQNVKTVANDVFKIQRDGLRESLQMGIITPDEYAKYTQTADLKGYLSRAYDYDKLGTLAGKDEFVTRISSMKLTGEDAQIKAQNILRAILPEEEAKSAIKQIGVTSDGKQKFAYIPPNVSEMLWKQFGVNGTTNVRSKHLDAPRVLPEEWESALEPFLINDMEAILASWSQDVFTRIEYARQFGPNDEVAKEIGHELSKYSTKLEEDFNTAYWTTVGDNKSQVLNSFVKAPELARDIVPKVKALQTYKLGLAQIANASQAPEQGLYWLLSQDGMPLPAVMNSWASGILKGLRSSFGDKELAYTADIFGATAQTLVLDSMGGINEAMHTILGRSISGPLELLNNPTTFLRFVQYFRMEDFQRRTAFFMGKAALEDTVKRKARLLALGNRADPKALARVNRTLEEMGLDTSKDPNSYTAEEVGLAGKRVSDIINFTNDPKDSPYLMQTFWGKFMHQFKSFIVKKTKFMNDYVLKPATRGNIKPLLAVGMVGTPLGMGTDAIKRFVTGDDEEYSWSEKMLRAHFMIGTLSAFGEIGKSAGTTAGWAASLLAGPSVADVGRWGHRAYKEVGNAIDPDKEVSGKKVFAEFLKQYNFPGKTAALEALAEEKSKQIKL